MHGKIMLRSEKERIRLAREFRRYRNSGATATEAIQLAREEIKFRRVLNQARRESQ